MTWRDKLHGNRLLFWWLKIEGAMPVLVRLRAKNFKGVRDGDVTFSPTVTALVGPNNSGKSTIVQAIQSVRCLFELPIVDPLAESNPAQYRAELVAKGEEKAIVALDLSLQSHEIDKFHKSLRERLANDSTARGRFTEDDFGLVPERFGATIEIMRDAAGYGVVRLVSMTAAISGGRTLELWSQPAPSTPPTLVSIEGIIEMAKTTSFSTRLDRLPQTSSLVSATRWPPAFPLEPGRKISTHFDLLMVFADSMRLVPAARHFPREEPTGVPKGGYINSSGLVSLPQFLNYLASGSLHEDRGSAPCRSPRWRGA